MEQSEYLKNLLKRLNEASEQVQFQREGQNPHTLSTIKFERDEFESIANYSKRQNILNEESHREFQAQALKQQIATHQNVVQQISEMIDNTKTSRNSPTLKFNPAKSRKGSESKYDHSARSKRQPSTRREKGDLVEVRDRLNDIITFLNAKIQSGPIAEIRRVVNIDDIKQSFSPKHSTIGINKNPEPANSNREGVLYLPKYELQDAKLVRSSEIMNDPQEISKFDKDYLNLKHSFDKLNDIHSSHSLQSVERSRLTAFTPSNFQRQHAHIVQPHYNQILQRPIPQEMNRYQTSSAIPAILINGKRLGGSNLPNNSNVIPEFRAVRPYSEEPRIRYIQNPPPNISSINKSYSLNKMLPINPSIPSTQYIPSDRPQAYPPAINISQPTFRTITSRPLSTQRSNTHLNHFQQPRLASHNPHFPPPIIHKSNIPVSPRFAQLPPKSNNQKFLQQSRVKKRFDFNKNYNELAVQSPIKTNPEASDLNKSKDVEERTKQLQKILPPPKPYTYNKSNMQNPFKKAEGSKKAELSLSKKSSRFRAELSNEILHSIAQQSEENQITRNLQASGKSSERQMSEVNSNIFYSKVKKFQGSGSTKLKKKGIDVSSKQIYLSQYSRHS